MEGVGSVSESQQVGGILTTALEPALPAVPNLMRQRLDEVAHQGSVNFRV